MSNKEPELCKYCGGDIEIRNPMGNCDHLYYPDNVNKSLIINQHKDEELIWEIKDTILSNINIDNFGNIVSINTDILSQVILKLIHQVQVTARIDELKLNLVDMDWCKQQVRIERLQSQLTQENKSV